MLNNSLKVIKIDQNMWQLWQNVCKNIILTSVHLLVLLSELFINERTSVTLR